VKTYPCVHNAIAITHTLSAQKIIYRMQEHILLNTPTLHKKCALIIDRLDFLKRATSSGVGIKAIIATKAE